MATAQFRARLPSSAVFLPYIAGLRLCVNWNPGAATASTGALRTPPPLPCAACLLPHAAFVFCPPPNALRLCRIICMYINGSPGTYMTTMNTHHVQKSNATFHVLGMAMLR